MPTTPFAIAVSLDGAGAHAAAWRTSADRPGAHTTASAWIERARTAERGRLDAVVIEDDIGLRAADEASGGLEGRLDAAVLASFLAPATHRTALVPAVTTTHTEPFHLSTSIATLDHVSLGRAGVLVQASARAEDAALYGRRDADSLEPDVLVRETADAVEAVRRLWDSWQDDAVIRDVATGRFLDRERIHPAAFEGELFSVEGASITPRPPQGQPPVLVRADLERDDELRLAAASADVVVIAPGADPHAVATAVAGADLVSAADTSAAASADVAEDAFARAFVAALARLAEASSEVQRTGDALRVWIEVDVLVEASDELAREALRGLDRLAGAPHRPRGLLLVGGPETVAAAVARLADAGADGVLLRPLRLPADLDALADEVAPRIRAAVAPRRPNTDLAAPAPASPAERRTFRAALGFASTAPNRNTHAAPFTARRSAIVREESRA